MITGWTYSEIDGITLWDVEDIQEAWNILHGKGTPKVSDAAEDLAAFVTGSDFPPLPACYRDN